VRNFVRQQQQLEVGHGPVCRRSTKLHLVSASTAKVAHKAFSASDFVSSPFGFCINVSTRKFLRRDFLLIAIIISL
jgi:hypothetical protein